MGAETKGEILEDDGLEAGERRETEAVVDVPVSLVQKDDASNIQNETAEEIAGEIEGMAGGIAEALGGSSDAGLDGRNPAIPVLSELAPRLRAARAVRQRGRICSKDVVVTSGADPHPLA